jgi:hypothetical protein
VPTTSAGALNLTIRQAAWAPVSVLTFCVIVAKAFNGYLLFPSLDIPTHFIGGVAGSYFLCRLIANLESVFGRIPRLIQSLFVCTGVGTVAMCWEFSEFVADRVLGTTMQLGLHDTLSDLFFGLLGSVVFLAIRTFRQSSVRSQGRSDAPNGAQ